MILYHYKNANLEDFNYLLVADVRCITKDDCCPKCGKSDFTDIRHFNLMFKTFQGVTDDSKSELYLRPETAQGIFVNFANIQRTSRKKIPFGVKWENRSVMKSLQETLFSVFVNSSKWS